jgi:hypothetical protein
LTDFLASIGARTWRVRDGGGTRISNYGTPEGVGGSETASPLVGLPTESDARSQSRPQPQPKLLFPDDFKEEDELAPVRGHPLARLAVSGVLGLLAAWGLFSLYLIVTVRSDTTGPSMARGTAPVASSPHVVDRLADTLALAVGAFDLRARLFDGRRMSCSDLARGVVELEERLTAYTMARRGELASLDSAHDARDQALYREVGAAERRFDRSACPRP